MVPQSAASGSIPTQIKSKLLIVDYYVLWLINVVLGYRDTHHRTLVLAVDLSCVLVKLVCGCIEVHSMFYCPVNDLKGAGLIGSAAHHYG